MSTPRRLNFQLDFSPDSQWLAYTVVGENYFAQVRLRGFTAAKNSDLNDSGR
jgi:tricorn protease